MRKFFSKVKNAVSKVFTKADELANEAALKVKEVKAEGYVDSGVKILIAVVIGALLLAGLYALFNTNIMPTVTRRVTELFSYSGN